MTRFLDILAGAVTVVVAVGLYVLAIQLFWQPEPILAPGRHEIWIKDGAGNRIYVVTPEEGTHRIDWVVDGEIPTICEFSLEQSENGRSWSKGYGPVDCQNSGTLSFNTYGSYVRVKVSPFAGDSGVRFSIDGKSTDAR